MERKEDIGRMHTAGFTIDFEYGELWRGLHRSNPLSFKRPYSWIVYKDRDKYMAEDWRGRIRYEDDDASEVINSCINALSDVGGKILIRSGTYIITSPLKIRSNLVLSGEGWGTVLKLDDGADTWIINDNDSESNIVIENIAFDGNGANQSDGSNRNDRVVIVLINKECLVLRNIKVVNARHGAGIVIGASNYVWIESSVFKDNGITDSAFKCDDVYIGSSKYVYVRDCYFGNCTDVGLAGDNNQNYIVRSCIFESCDVAGFTIWNASDDKPIPTRYSFTGNILYGNGRGFYTGRASGLSNVVTRVIINNNMFFNTGNLEFKDGTEHVEFKNNDVRNSSIKIYGTVYRIHIEGNRITDTDTGIEFVSGTITAPVIKNNRFVAVTNPVLETVSPSNPLIRENLGYTTENNGVAVFSGDGSTTEFKIEHGLAKAPSKYGVSPLTPDAHADKTISADDTYITITFSTAPPSGTDNLKFGWWAEV